MSACVFRSIRSRIGPNHDRFECQTAIDSDAILHYVSGLFFLFFFTGYVSVIILITGHSLYTESTKQMSIN